MSKSIFQSFKTMTTKQLNRRIVFTFAMASVFYAGLAYSLYVDPLPKVSPAYASPYIQFISPYLGPRAIIYKFSIKKADENEIIAHQAGGAPQ